MAVRLRHVFVPPLTNSSDYADSLQTRLSEAPGIPASNRTQQAITGHTDHDGDVTRAPGGLHGRARARYDGECERRAGTTRLRQRPRLDRGPVARNAARRARPDDRVH